MTTLIDTSVWVDFFRGTPAVVSRVDSLLASGDAATCGPVLAELLSGARDRAHFDRLARQLDALEWLDAPAGVWRALAELRFTLARHGLQVHLVDLLIAVTASAAGAVLLTRDRDFEAIGRVVPLDLRLC